ncbi:uncharacterized protein ATNIH1004_005542 [Aspergillus tanneri]|uniref:Uncharacterized protein n=2 Tax=Aspergillus tanneri TaxID=1220188 RepID=A0A5M9MWR0_9EURO|nr:uncharacterized protein ATNIH1004_005542 [Aspergillus tanneri]KAA8646867.1 hypothetical protein ATNIH1004_005542 [Aspergillus tanneri]
MINWLPGAKGRAPCQLFDRRGINSDVGGEKLAVPRLRPGAHDSYNNTEDMLKHPKTFFTNPNKAPNECRQYSNLKMAPGDMSYMFISNFPYLAVEAGVDKDYWKEDLYQQLLTKLQELTMSRFNDNLVNFDQYVDECARLQTKLIRL